MNQKIEVFNLSQNLTPSLMTFEETEIERDEFASFEFLGHWHISI
jgi:hypothetical protein